jgi:hypothetical protein
MALHEIDSDLKTAEATLSHWERTFPDLIRAEANAKVDYELAWAEAVKKITGAVKEGEKPPTVAVLEAEATRICASQIKAKRTAEAEAEIAKKLIGIAETTLTSVQSRLKLVEIEQGLSALWT